MSRDEIDARIRELERRIADLKARWPKHSVPPSMALELEELEDELEELKRLQVRSTSCEQA
ncbi:MAG: histidine kinase [Chloroflexi bacterium]|nr:MAG: histidine kinase [Chloroflexota bacterium]HDN80716.1 histidine kinase [Chloroflexota bacterium]